MAETGVNWLAVLVAAAAGFAFGAAWYMTLGKAWMAALSRSAAEIRASGQGPLAFATAAAAQLVMAFFLAGLVGHLEAGAPTLAGALTTGFFVWLAFIATTMMVNHRFQGARWSLTAIDAGHWLGVLLVQGLVIGLFG
jgi:hypothetical protein